MPVFELKRIETETLGEFYVSAMSETYSLSFGNDDMFRRWAGPTGADYLLKLGARSRLPENFCRTLFIDHKPAGIIEAYSVKPESNEEREGYIAFIFVNAAARGTGAGSFLLEKVLEWAKSQHFSILRLTVDSANPNAIKFYEKHGWQDVGASPKSPTARNFELRL